MPETTAAGPCAQLQEQLAACVANNVRLYCEEKEVSNFGFDSRPMADVLN